LKGHGFSRAAGVIKDRALAPEGDAPERLMTQPSCVAALLFREARSRHANRQAWPRESEWSARRYDLAHRRTAGFPLPTRGTASPGL